MTSFCLVERLGKETNRVRTYVRTLATATAEREATTGEKDVLFKREGRRKVFEIERAIDKPENPPDIFIVSSWPPDYSVQ